MIREPELFVFASTTEEQRAEAFFVAPHLRKGGRQDLIHPTAMNLKLITALEEPFHYQFSQDEIARSAYFLWEQRGRPEGQETEIWLAAEARLRDDSEYYRNFVRQAYARWDDYIQAEGWETEMSLVADAAPWRAATDNPDAYDEISGEGEFLLPANSPTTSFPTDSRIEATMGGAVRMPARHSA